MNRPSYMRTWYIKIIALEFNFTINIYISTQYKILEIYRKLLGKSKIDHIKEYQLQNEFSTGKPENSYFTPLHQ